MSQFYPLKIKEIIRETPQAVSISFEIPQDLIEEFNFKAGQYITIKTAVGQEEVRRAYSICSAPGSEDFKVTVKEVEGGKFSVIANNKLKAGDTLEVHPPEGKFVLTPAEGEINNYAAFAAGSGITPVLSIIKTVLKEEPKSRFILTYGNKSPEETIFFKELLELQAKFPDRLFIEFVYSRTREENAHFGRIEKSTVNFVVKNRFKDQLIKEFFLCGPEEMINQVTNILVENGIPKEKILFELFSSDNTGEVKADVEGQTELTILVDDEETTLTMDMKGTVLEAALENDLDVPYSCQGGICSSCIARITEGKAEMRKNQILTDDELEEGLILTCQAQPTTPTLKVDYDDV
ncbi:ferredoxin--NADP reductase [Autumnicola psychrophila]|uniref:Ferredoxin--NADP reductase n=1 Tax=Autumnicola psychrophila TaxID=3075592 RepID=A0ABU3DP42_9FLAO|nr:ferredoxin--NADP reductase [Zunongwangia sp. F225]MDT0685493.1 ferredoxin--NADP reductase [Zunongwangia sp. F225]